MRVPILSCVAASTILGADFFGNSQALPLPPGDAFDQSELDFVPLASDPRIADTGFSISDPVDRVPEPSFMGYLFIGFAVFWFRVRSRHWAKPTRDDQ